MGIEVKDGQIFKMGADRFQGGKGQRVIAAQQQRPVAFIDNAGHRLLDVNCSIAHARDGQIAPVLH